MPSTRELLQLTDFVVALHEGKTFEQVTDIALQGLKSLVPCDWPLVSALVSGPPNIRIERPRSDLCPVWDEYDVRSLSLIHEDPTYTNRLRLTMDGAAQPRDFAAPGEFEKTRHFNQVWRPMGIRQMLRFSNPGVLGIGFIIVRNTSRPFSGDEIDMAEVIGRQMDAAILKLMQKHNGKVPLGGQHVPMHTGSWLVCSAEGSILRSPPASRDHYRLCLGRNASLKKLPGDWISVFISRVNGGPPEPKEFILPGRAITAHIAPIIGSPGEFSVFFVERQLEEDPLTPLVKLGLTYREAEVMHWMIEGKTNPEIATIMGISTLTAKKHVENIRTKFNVSNRTAAVVYAMEQVRN